jgi:hypothetical protein
MITYKLKAMLVKDMVLLEKFIKFLTTYKHLAITPAIVANMPDVVALGIYMDFLEQEYGIGISADNSNFTIYLIPVDDDSKFFPRLKATMIKDNTHIIVMSSHTMCTTVIDNYIDGIITGLANIILPF